MICPNLNNSKIRHQFSELVSVLGEDVAYYVWNKNRGYPLDSTSTGGESKLFTFLTAIYSRDDAIRLKSKVYSKAFTDWFGNWMEGKGSKIIDNMGEPLMLFPNRTAISDVLNVSVNKKLVEYKSVITHVPEYVAPPVFMKSDTVIRLDSRDIIDLDIADSYVSDTSIFSDGTNVVNVSNNLIVMHTLTKMAGSNKADFAKLNNFRNIETIDVTTARNKLRGNLLSDLLKQNTTDIKVEERGDNTVYSKPVTSVNGIQPQSNIGTIADFMVNLTKEEKAVLREEMKDNEVNIKCD